MAKEVWRLVNEEAIRCTECKKNRHQLGGPDICVADDEICIFMKKKLDIQKTWEDFHEAYNELNRIKQAKAQEGGGA